MTIGGQAVEVHPQLASIAALPGAISVVGLFIASLSLFLSLLIIVINKDIEAI
jgi:hypothetical protein